MQDSIIMEKKREMTKYAYIAMKDFPNYERFSLVSEIKQTMYTISRLIIRVGKKYYKKTTLEDLDVEIAILKDQILLAYELKYIDSKRYEIWIKKVSEIGRMIGGWIKTEKEKLKYNK